MQYNKLTSNPHFLAASKYISDLDEISKQGGCFFVPQLNVQGRSSSFDELKHIVLVANPI